MVLPSSLLPHGAKVQLTSSPFIKRGKGTTSKTEVKENAIRDIKSGIEPQIHKMGDTTQKPISEHRAWKEEAEKGLLLD